MTEPKPARDYVDLRIATYNIHRCRGLDRRVGPARVVEEAEVHRLAVLREQREAHPAAVPDGPQLVGRAARNAVGAFLQG